MIISTPASLIPPSPGWEAALVLCHHLATRRRSPVHRFVPSAPCRPHHRPVRRTAHRWPRQGPFRIQDPDFIRLRNTLRGTR
jgi:hypothetical protein